MIKTLKFNDRELTTADLFRLTEIEDAEYKTENEKFLCELIDKFFFRMAQLQDDNKTLQDTMEQA